MNSYERYTARLQGAPVDRAPNFNIMMQHAAHHIGQPLARYYLDHRVLVAANLAGAADYHLDISRAALLILCRMFLPSALLSRFLIA